MGDELQDCLWTFWCWLRGNESGSTTIRNLGFVISAVAAFIFAFWRSTIAERQANTAERGLLNERYQKGAEMLDSEKLSVRLGGLYALARLSEDHPEQYHVEVMRLFCAFARHPSGTPVENIALSEGGKLTGDAKFVTGWEDAGDERAKEKGKESDRPQRVREDVQAVMDLLRRRPEKHIELEREANFRLDLRGVKLRFGSLKEMNLDRAFLMKADLSNAILSQASLIDAILSGAHLENTNLTGTNLSNARFSGRDNTDPRSEPPATGMTQQQLDRAVASPDRPPRLENCIDTQTNKQLVWNWKTSASGHRPGTD
ncbi:MAG: pentapeptide repeat-containing protein [Candidatus Aminicenantes bacterium]|nr:pentapeptide repeat-containing protein [Candidatus Aminicenantes bacterium]